MKSTPAYIQPFLEAAQKYVQRALADAGVKDIELDGSEASLAYVDHYVRIAGIAQSSGINEEKMESLIALVAPALAAYFGEIAIAKLGGHWETSTGDAADQLEPLNWRIVLGSGGLSFSPVGMAAAALAEGDVDGFDSSFTVRRDLMEQLEEALSTAPPVDQAYYYSFTGRLETLAQVSDVLVELDRRKGEQN